MMTPDEVLGAVYLLVSASSAIAQGQAMREMAKDHSEERIHRHLVRTVTWRFTLQVVYVGVAIVSLIFEPIIFKVVALVVFTAAQLIWRANTRADVNLRRELAMTTPAPRQAGKLGKLPYDPTKPNIVLEERHFPRLVAGRQRGEMPLAPETLSRLDQDDYPMYGNDKYGDCVWAMIGHGIQVLTKLGRNEEVTVTTEALLKGYSDVTGFNPDDPNTDQGTNIQDALNYWRKVGIRKPDDTVDKIIAFAEVKTGDRDLFMEAVAVFGVPMLGINFPTSAMEQFNNHEPWSVVLNSDIEGGHAILGGDYDRISSYDLDTREVTWGAIQEMHDDFFHAYVEEVWFVVTQDWLNNNGLTPDNFNLEELAADYTALTGKPAPFRPAPQPSPAPSPAPAPDIPGWSTFVQDAEGWLRHRHTGVNQTFARNVREFLEANGVTP